MIVRRIAAGAAGIALVGTAFAAAPATAKSQGETQITLNGGLVQNLTADSVKLSVIKPAKVKKGVVTLPVSNRNGILLEHSGGIKFKSPTGYVTLEDPVINWKTGYMSATVANSLTPDPLVLEKLLKLTGGTKKAKQGVWKRATLKLSKNVDPIGDPSAVINGVLGSTSFKTGQTIGKVTITLK